MKYYVIAEMQVTDPGWVSAYVEKVTRLIEQRGGRYLARTSKIEKLEGDRARPQVIVITEWPSREAALAFYESDEYRAYRESRVAGSISEIMLVAGEDITGAAHIAE